MAQAKVGDMVIAAGRAVKDAEMRLVGDNSIPLCSFGLIVGRKADDSGNIFANCKAWRGLAEYAENIQKGDNVCVVGKIEKSEYNGKTYSDLVVEWLNIAGKDGVAISPSGKAFPSGVQFEDTSTSSFSDLDSGDGELPF